MQENIQQLHNQMNYVAIQHNSRDQGGGAKQQLAEMTAQMQDQQSKLRKLKDQRTRQQWVINCNWNIQPDKMCYL